MTYLKYNAWLDHVIACLMLSGSQLIRLPEEFITEIHSDVANQVRLRGSGILVITSACFLRHHTVVDQRLRPSLVPINSPSSVWSGDVVRLSIGSLAACNQRGAHNLVSTFVELLLCLCHSRVGRTNCSKRRRCLLRPMAHSDLIDRK